MSAESQVVVVVLLDIAVVVAVVSFSHKVKATISCVLVVTRVW